MKPKLGDVMVSRHCEDDDTHWGYVAVCIPKEHWKTLREKMDMIQRDYPDEETAFVSIVFRPSGAQLGWDRHYSFEGAMHTIPAEEMFDLCVGIAKYEKGEGNGAKG